MLERLNKGEQKRSEEVENKYKINSQKLSSNKEEFKKGNKEIKLYNLHADGQSGVHGIGMEIYAKNYQEAEEIFQSFIDIDDNLWNEPCTVKELDGKYI